MKKLFTFFGVLFLYTSICIAGINPVLEPIPADDFTMLKSLEGKWAGTLERTNGSSDSFNIEYSITSNGSALMEESFTGGIEMLTIFNLQNDELLLTHYCGLKNRPVSRLESSKDGVFMFTTDAELSNLSLTKDMFVTSWKIDTMPENPNQAYYEYTVSGPKGVAFTATCNLTRVN